MEEICTAKLAQCKAFKDALRKSGSTLLVHNTETDPVWGCGYDMRGSNMMGKILMSVRNHDKLYQKEFPSLPTTAPPATSMPQKQATHPNCVPAKPKVLVVGNSNVRGLSQGLNDRGLDSTGYVYPGQTTVQIRNRIDKIDYNPDAVLVHTGDIEVRAQHIPLTVIIDNLKCFASDLHTKFPSARIVFSSLHPALHNKTLDKRISDFNSTLASLCSDTPEFVYLCNKNSKLQRDNIHLTARSRDMIARTTARHVRQCV
jgi:hypothetical protein